MNQMQSKTDNSSLASETLEGLTVEQTERLTAVLDRYLVSLEAGANVPLETLLHENEDIRRPLRVYFDKLRELHNFAAGFSPGLAGQPSDSDVPEETSNPSESGSSDLRTPSETTDDSADRQVATQLLEGELEGTPIRRLGDFDLIRVIGRGGMGIVYEAQQLSLKRKVALKLLPLISVLDARQVTRFRNEAQAAASLQHPHIVPVYAVGSYQGIHFYAMRLIDGHPLDAIIAGLKELRNPLSRNGSGEEEASHTQNAASELNWKTPDMKRVLRIGIDAASALAHAHDEGIVHRDIKPSNLLVDPLGKLWITDFGLARRACDHTLTATGDMLGTLRYMSPEQARAQNALIDARSDIYSLGVTLYELLTLQPAIPGENSLALLRSIETHTPIPLRTLRPDLPRDLVTVIETAMAKNRDERYLTAQQLSEDLQCVLEGRPTLARPPSPIMRAVKWAVRHQRLVVLAAATILFTSVALGISTWRAQRDAWRLEELWKKHQALANRTLPAVADSLANVPGAERGRREVLVALIDYYRQYVQEFRGNRATRVGVSNSLFQLGNLYNELGQLPEAIEKFREAQLLSLELVESEPRKLEYQRLWATSTSKLGRCLTLQGETKEARSNLEKAIVQQESLSHSNPDSIAFATELAESHNYLALLLIELDQELLAERLLTATLERLSKMSPSSNTTDATEDSTRLQFQKMLAATYNNLSGIVSSTDPTSAAQLYERSIEMQKNSPGDGGAQLAVTYSNLGKARAHAGNLPLAVTAYEEAIKIQRRLLTLSPQNRTYTRDIAVSLNNLGMARLKSSQMQSAEADFREAIELLLRLLKQTPDDPGVSHDLGGTYHNLATLMLQLAPDKQLVDSAFEEAIRHQTRALDIAPTAVRYREFLDNHFNGYFNWLRSSFRDDRALATAASRRQLWSKNPHKLVDLASDLAKIALQHAQASKGQGVFQRYADEALESLKMAQQNGFRVQSLLEQEPFLSLGRLQPLSELTRP